MVRCPGLQERLQLELQHLGVNFTLDENFLWKNISKCIEKK
jgi:hypothetical protein